MNIITITGRLATLPLYYSGEVGKESLLNFCIANTTYGRNTEKTMFIGCTAYGHVADAIHKSLYKGVGVIVEGRLDIDDEHKPKIIARRIEITQHTKKHLEELGVKSTEVHKASINKEEREEFMEVNPDEKLPWE